MFLLLFLFAFCYFWFVIYNIILHFTYFHIQQ